MSRRQFLFCWILLIDEPRLAAAATRASRCAELRDRMRRTQSRLRAGYSSGQGQKLREQMRRLRKKYYRECR